MGVDTLLLQVSRVITYLAGASQPIAAKSPASTIDPTLELLRVQQPFSSRDTALQQALLLVVKIKGGNPV